MAIFRRIINFFSRRYWLFLLLVVFLSYGQLLFMYPWQDDHALFFKLGNIEGAAGYLGAGVFGEGAYKYTAAFYYPIYLLFGYQVPYYFALSLIFYCLATLTVYKALSNSLGKEIGRLTSFLFACGYLASDGFIRLYNSVGTSLSIILLSFLFLAYWKFYKSKKFIWYFLAVFCYFCAVEFVRYRTHYLIAVILLFELLFLVLRKISIQSIIFFFIRTLPFVFVFYRYFVQGGDERSGQVVDLVVGVVSGDYAKLYGFFASLANLVVPDWLSIRMSGSVLRYSYFLFNWILRTPSLNLDSFHKLLFLLGIFALVLCGFLVLKLKGERRLLAVFFFFWALLNLLVYSAYQPMVAYETSNRFFAHSFFAFSSFLGCLVFDRKKARGILLALVVLLGIGNLVNSVLLQRNIVLGRSLPAKKFYDDLKTQLPILRPGDIIYFDVADDSRSRFADAFSVAQMPEETAIAWQYGLDRYDIRRVTEFADLQEYLLAGQLEGKDGSSIKVTDYHTFFYSNGELIETTGEIKNLLDSRKKLETEFSVSAEERGLVIVPRDEVKSLVPMKITLSLVATPNLPSAGSSSVSGEMMDFYRQAVNYRDNLAIFRKEVKVSADSEWRDEVADLAVDGDLSTVWRPDRVEFGQKSDSYLVLDLKRIESVDRFVWINAYENHIPTRYQIETSKDGVNWQKVFETEVKRRIRSGDEQVVHFSPTLARFVRFRIFATLSGDSPGISEAWVVTERFAGVDLLRAKSFLQSPFENLDPSVFPSDIFALLGGRGDLRIWWRTNKSPDWQTSARAVHSFAFDSRTRTLAFELPASGTRLEAVRIESSQIPARIRIMSFVVEYSSRND